MWLSTFFWRYYQAHVPQSVLKLTFSRYQARPKWFHSRHFVDFTNALCLWSMWQSNPILLQWILPQKPNTRVHLQALNTFRVRLVAIFRWKLLHFHRLNENIKFSSVSSQGCFVLSIKIKNKKLSIFSIKIKCGTHLPLC